VDRVTAGILKEWVRNYGADLPDEATEFEHFVNFIVLSRQHEQQFSVEDHSCGGRGALGIDGFALSVNGELVSDAEELDDALGSATQIEASITFVQSKTSPGYNLGEFSVFADTCVAMLTSDTAPHPALVEQHAMVQALFDASPRFRSNPTCRLYYVSTGNWMSPAPFMSKIDDTQTRLEDTNLLSKIDVNVWGAR